MSAGVALAPVVAEPTGAGADRAPRLVAAALVLTVLGAVAWACLARVDVVAVAPGRLVPTGRVKTVQPFEAGIVTALHVREGQPVAAGQALLDLDTSAARADLARLAAEHALASADAWRLARLLDGDDEPRATDGVPAAAVARLAAERAAHRAALDALAQELRGNRAEHAAGERRVAMIEATLPLLAERADALGGLAARALVPRADWLALQEARIGREHERAVEHAALAVLDARHAALARRLAQARADARARWHAERAALRTRLAELDADIGKAAHRIALGRLRAPVAGRVQGLALHTIGGVVTPAQALLTIVPQDDALRVEARVRNRDIGFVRPGQRAAVKIDTFPFTRYGLIEGRVESLSPDAVADAAGGLAYAAAVSLARTTMAVDGRDVALVPGMTATVEFHLGRRPLVEYLLSPLARRRHDAARER